MTKLWNHELSDLRHRRDVLGHEKAVVIYSGNGDGTYVLDFIASGTHDQAVRLVNSTNDPKNAHNQFWRPAHSIAITRDLKGV